jgi:integrase
MNEIGLGHWPEVSLAQAKAGWEDHRFHLRNGRDPKDVRRVSAGMRVTFADATEKFIERHKPHKSESWLRNTKIIFKHCVRLEREAVATIMPDKVEEVILKIESPSQARRTIDTLKQLFDFTVSQGWRTWENPSRWEIHKHNFPGLVHIPKGTHPAPDYWEMPEFLRRLRPHQAHSVAAIQFEIGIWTALRPNKELRLIQWSEIDWDRKILNVPGWRMKNGEPFRQPLVDRAITLLKHLEKSSNGSPYVFTGRSEEALAERGMIQLLRFTIGYPKEKADVHGTLRKPIRTWCTVKKFDYAASEMILGHKVGTPVSRAYVETDMLDERREIMNQWAEFCG